MRTKADPEVVLDDAVVEHARFRGIIQSERDVAESGTAYLRLFQDAMEQIFVLGGSGFDDLPGSDSEPGTDNRASRERYGIRPANLPVDRFRTNGRLEAACRQRRSNESAADVLGADDAVAHDRRDSLRLKPQVGPRLRIDADLLPPPERPGQRGARAQDFLQVHRERFVIAAVPFLVVEAVGLGALRREAPNRQVDVPDPPLPSRFVLPVAPQTVRLELLGWDVPHPTGVRGTAEVDVRRLRLGERMLDRGGRAQPLGRQLAHRREPQIIRHEGEVRVAPGAACLEGQRFRERDGGRIGVDREHVLPAKAEGRADNLAGERNPRFEPRRWRLPRLKGHGLTNLAGRFKGLFESGSGTLAGLVPDGERLNLP